MTRLLDYLTIRVRLIIWKTPIFLVFKLYYVDPIQNSEYSILVQKLNIKRQKYFKGENNAENNV